MTIATASDHQKINVSLLIAVNVMPETRYFHFSF